MRARRGSAAWICAIGLFAAGCGKKDNSSDTDRAAEDLTKAQAEAAERRQGLIANEAAIEREKREVAAAQQAITEKQALLEGQHEALGSAQAGLQAARTTYTTAVAERFAKLDAALATLSTRTDAASADARAGLRARRDQLASKLAALHTTADPAWAESTKEIDTTFDAIEHDLRAANR